MKNIHVSPSTLLDSIDSPTTTSQITSLVDTNDKPSSRPVKGLGAHLFASMLHEIKEKANPVQLDVSQTSIHPMDGDKAALLHDDRAQKLAEVFINACAADIDQKPILLGTNEKSKKKKKFLRMFSRDALGFYLPSERSYFLNYTIKAHSPIYMVMMIIVHIAVFYNLFFIPLRWAFVNLSLLPPNKIRYTRLSVMDNSIAFIFLDLLADLIYFLDILLLQSHIQYTSEISGEVIKDYKSTAKRYFTSRAFVIDSISLIYPVINEIFLLSSCFPNCSNFICCRNSIMTTSFTLCCIFSHPIFRIMRLLKLIKTYQFIEIIERKISWTQQFRIVRALIQLLLHGHLIGCFFFIFFLEQDGMFAGIYQRYGDIEGNEITVHPIMFSFYWGFLLATNIHNQPRPSSSFQYAWMVACHMLGALHMAYLYAVFVSALKIMNWHKNQFIIQSQRSKKIFEIYPSTAASKKHKVTEYYEYGFENHDELFENIVLSYFPRNMRLNLLSCNYGTVLRNCAIFKGMSDGFLRQIMLLMENRFFLPGEYIYQKNIQANEMYIVTKGLVRIRKKFSRSGGAYHDEQIKSGFAFGFLELFDDELSERKRPGDAMAVGYVHLLSIHLNILESIRYSYLTDSDREKFQKNRQKIQDALKLSKCKAAEIKGLGKAQVLSNKERVIEMTKIVLQKSQIILSLKLGLKEFEFEKDISSDSDYTSDKIKEEIDQISDSDEASGDEEFQDQLAAPNIKIEVFTNPPSSHFMKSMDEDVMEEGKIIKKELHCPVAEFVHTLILAPYSTTDSNENNSNKKQLLKQRHIHI